jgi:hypothetical protein
VHHREEDAEKLSIGDPCRSEGDLEQLGVPCPA